MAARCVNSLDGATALHVDQLDRVGPKTSAFQIGVVDSVGHA